MVEIIEAATNANIHNFIQNLPLVSLSVPYGLLHSLKTVTIIATIYVIQILLTFTMLDFLQ